MKAALKILALLFFAATFLCGEIFAQQKQSLSPEHVLNVEQEKSISKISVDRSPFDIVRRSNPQKATVISSIAFVPKNYAKKSLITLILPIPRTSYYQNISNVKVFSSFNGRWQIMTHPETGENYAAGVFANIQAPIELALRFNAELFDVSFDLTKIQKLYPYNKNNPHYTTYIGGSDKNHPFIQRVSKQIREDAAVTNEIEYVKAAMRFVKENMTPQAPVRHSGKIDDIVKYATGDCGCHSVLFNALLRAGGIPARMVYGIDPFNMSTIKGFQHEKNRHGWSEFYLENYGWIPADATANFFGQRGYICTSYGENLTVLSSSYGKLQPRKIALLQRYSSWFWYDTKMDCERFFRFDAVK